MDTNTHEWAEQIYEMRLLLAYLHQKGCQTLGLAAYESGSVIIPRGS